MAYRPELSEDLKEEVDEFLSNQEDIFLSKPEFIREAIQEKLERESRPESDQLSLSEKRLLKEFVNTRLKG